MPQTTRAYTLSSQTGPEALQQTTIAVPDPGPGEIVMRVRASSLNFRDHLTTTGRYGPGHDMTGRVPLSDGAGDVAAVGPGVTGLKAGDRVVANFFPNWIDGHPTSEMLRVAHGGAFAPGFLADHTIVPAAAVVKIPDALTYEEAATLPCAGVTAWYALFETFKLHPGQSVLAQGTGGVSIFALQLAKLAGARVILTSSSDDKLAKAKLLGADETINYAKTPDWDREVKRLTAGNGVDYVVEVGGAGTIEKAVSAAAIGGGISVIGVLSGMDSKLSLFQTLAKQLRLHGVYVGSAAHLAALTKAVVQGGIKPVIDKTFGFADARAAFAYQATNAHFGKIVVVNDD